MYAFFLSPDIQKLDSTLVVSTYIDANKAPKSYSKGKYSTRPLHQHFANDVEWSYWQRRLLDPHSLKDAMKIWRCFASRAWTLAELHLDSRQKWIMTTRVRNKDCCGAGRAIGRDARGSFSIPEFWLSLYGRMVVTLVASLTNISPFGETIESE